VGLAIVKRAMEKLRGEISVESVLEQGTTFRIKLPVPNGTHAESHKGSFPSAD
jgi:signal transduction histidine kinase